MIDAQEASFGHWVIEVVNANHIIGHGTIVLHNLNALYPLRE